MWFAVQQSSGKLDGLTVAACAQGEALLLLMFLQAASAGVLALVEQVDEPAACLIALYISVLPLPDLQLQHMLIKPCNE
jgi:hypothetical protein